MSQDSEDIGFMKAEIKGIKERQDEVFTIVKELKTASDEGKGARKALHWVYLICGGLLAFKFGDVSKLFTGGK